MGTRNRTLWFLILIATIPLSVFGQVVISEIMYDPPSPGDDAGREWIEIHNVGATSVDISSWRLFEGGTNHRLVIAQGNSFMSAGSYAVISDKPSEFLSDYPHFSGTIWDSTFSLNNTAGEMLVLRDQNGATTSAVVYRPSWGAGGDGNSLQLVGDSWVAAPPTPGAVNVYVPPQPKPETKEPVKSPTSAQPMGVTPKTAKLSAAKPSPSVPISPASSDVTSSSPLPRGQSSPFVWYALLGGVVAVAVVAFWLGGRREGDEFTIIEEKNPE